MLLRFVARLHFEAVRLATLAGGLSKLSLAHKPGGLELLRMVARLVAIQNQASDMHQRLEATFHPGDWEHSNLHGVAECTLL